MNGLLPELRLKIAQLAHLADWQETESFVTEKCFMLARGTECKCWVHLENRRTSYWNQKHQTLAKWLPKE